MYALCNLPIVTPCIYICKYGHRLYNNENDPLTHDSTSRYVTVLNFFLHFIVTGIVFLKKF